MIGQDQKENEKKSNKEINENMETYETNKIYKKGKSIFDKINKII